MCWKFSYKPERTHLLLSSRFSRFFFLLLSSCSGKYSSFPADSHGNNMMWYFGVWSTLSLTRTQPLQTKRCILAAPREAAVWIKWISLLPWLYISKNLAGCTQLSLFHCSLAANNVSWSQEGNVFDYIRSCDYVAWLPFFPSGRHILTNLTPPPPQKKNRFSVTMWLRLAGNLWEGDDAKRDGQKRTGVEKRGTRWMETEI